LQSQIEEDHHLHRQAKAQVEAALVLSAVVRCGVSDHALRNAWRRRLDATFLALNRRLLPARARPEAELAARVRRAEEYVLLGAEVVVEMGSETYGKRPAARVWAITRRADRAHRRHENRQQRDQRRQADRASRTDRTSRVRAPVQEREVTADAR
jgi:hypothetical protein